MATASTSESEWVAESLRLTVFSTDAAVDVSAQLYRDLTGDEPEVRSVQRAGPAVQEQGPLAGIKGILTCDTKPGRVDVSLSPVVQAEGTLDGFPNIGAWREAVEVFSRLLHKWIGNGPDCSRVAVGAVALLPVFDRVSGYRALQTRLVDVRIDPEHSFDFSYAINRPRQYRIGNEDVRINRLSRWSVARLAGVQLQVSGAAAPVLVTQTGVEAHACRLVLDINTAAERAEPIPRDELARLFPVLVEFADEILAKGDVP